MERGREQWLVRWEGERQARERHAHKLARRGLSKEEIDARLGKQVEVGAGRGGLVCGVVCQVTLEVRDAGV